MSADNVWEISSTQLGGLLSSYALSKEPRIAVRADELGRLLLPAVEKAGRRKVEIGHTTPTTLGVMDSFPEL